MRTSVFKFMLGLLALAFAGCTESVFEGEIELQREQSREEVFSMKMNFCAELTAFDSENKQTRSAETWSWNHGDVVYLQYHNGTKIVRGHAVYSESTDSWEAFWNGTIGTVDRCEVYYFQGVSTNDKHSVILNATHAIYADKSGAYSVNGSEITIQANLKPLTSRIRFKGKSGLGIEVTGITYYTGYDADNNQFTTTDGIEGNVYTSGYTSYYYVTFTDESKRELSIVNSEDGDDVQFVKSFGASVLRIGESGYITVPTEDTNKGWTISTPPTEQEFTVTGNGKTVSFKMKRIKHGTFQMGSTTGYSDEKPVHSVTLTKSYYMGETEVTQALWYAVMGQKPSSSGSSWSSSYGLGDNYPAYYISSEDCQQFLTQLNQMTGTNFRFPTEAEWEFAAKGGTRSKGYSYSGSNTIDDVAWYIDNSGSKTHEVAGKAANELGLYDMSGNVWEWCYDWYGSYSSSAQTDPTGATSGSIRVCRGGSWSCSTSNCRCASRGCCSSSSQLRNYGFRLAL